MPFLCPVAGRLRHAVAELRVHRLAALSALGRAALAPSVQDGPAHDVGALPVGSVRTRWSRGRRGVRGGAWSELSSLRLSAPRAKRATKSVKSRPPAPFTHCHYSLPTPSFLPSSKRTFSQPFKEKYISEVVRIGSIII